MSLYQKIQFVIRKHTSCRDNERLSVFTGLLKYFVLCLLKNSQYFSGLIINQGTVCCMSNNCVSLMSSNEVVLYCPCYCITDMRL